MEGMGRPIGPPDREAVGEEVKIAGQVAVVTGGGSGLGHAMALGLAREGGEGLMKTVAMATRKGSSLFQERLTNTTRSSFFS